MYSRGPEAVRYGLAQEVYPSNELIDKALELAHLIATKAPRSVTAAKAVMNGFRNDAFAAGMDTKCQFNMPKGGIGSYGQHVMNTIEQCPLPVIAAVNGFAFGGPWPAISALQLRKPSWAWWRQTWALSPAGAA